MQQKGRQKALHRHNAHQAYVFHRFEGPFIVNINHEDTIFIFINILEEPAANFIQRDDLWHN
jgi:hypothetical protein